MKLYWFWHPKLRVGYRVYRYDGALCVLCGFFSFRIGRKATPMTAAQQAELDQLAQEAQAVCAALDSVCEKLKPIADGR